MIELVFKRQYKLNISHEKIKQNKITITNNTIKMKHFITSLAIVAAIATADHKVKDHLSQMMDNIESRLQELEGFKAQVNMGVELSGCADIESCMEGWNDGLEELEDFRAQVDMGVELSGCADIVSCLTISNDRLDNLEAEVDVLDGKQITEDFHYINSDKIELEKGVRNTLYEWTVKAGETMNLEVLFNTNQAAIKNK